MFFKDWGIIKRYSSIHEIPEYTFYYKNIIPRKYNEIYEYIVLNKNKVNDVIKLPNLQEDIETEAKDNNEEIKTMAMENNKYEISGQIILDDGRKYIVEHKPKVKKLRITYLYKDKEELVSVLYDKKIITGEATFEALKNNTSKYYNKEWGIYIIYKDKSVEIAHKNDNNTMLTMYFY